MFMGVSATFAWRFVMGLMIAEELIRYNPWIRGTDPRNFHSGCAPRMTQVTSLITAEQPALSRQDMDIRVKAMLGA